jgi:small subunit ribosomal protein S26e
MTFKRRNGGRSKKGRGHAKAINCDGCGRKTGKDKAITRFQVKNIVESAAQRDIRDASAYETYTLPKTYLKVCYCMSCACHRRIVKVRSKIKPNNNRKDRAAPARFNNRKKD